MRHQLHSLGLDVKEILLYAIFNALKYYWVYIKHKNVNNKLEFVLVFNKKKCIFLDSCRKRFKLKNDDESIACITKYFGNAKSRTNSKRINKPVVKQEKNIKEEI